MRYFLCWRRNLAGSYTNLLMVHGMLDDNVLFQDDARMVQRFIDNDKYVSVMYYPRDDHSIARAKCP